MNDDDRGLVDEWPAAWLTTVAGPRCPTCGAGDARPIARGYPSAELFAAREAGIVNVALGGCVIVDEMPTRRCQECGDEFAHALDPADSW